MVVRAKGLVVEGDATTKQRPPPANRGDYVISFAMHDDLETLQRESFNYFVHEANPANGLIRDKTEADWPASIAATGLALECYPVGVERGFMTRSAAVERTLATLRFFSNSPQGSESDARVIAAFIIISWICRPGGALGAVSCQPSTAPSC